MAKQFGRKIEPCARRAVAWYSPSILLQAGRELFSSIDFQRNLDRRESFFGPIDVIDLSVETATAEKPFWFDFISDTGDSGNATYAVARAALQPALKVEGSSEPLASGSLLVLGGDLSYPGASPEEYQFRFIEPFEMAKQQISVEQAAANAPAARAEPSVVAATAEKTVVAIPQNHDWFDSLSTFCRYFVNRDAGDFIGAKTPQKRTYFAVKLPHDWWILGFDFALGGDIDRNQFEAFNALLGTPTATRDADGKTRPDAHRLSARSRLILVYPEPYWCRELGDGAPAGYPKRYQRLESLLENSGAHIAMRIAGDQHHYARDSAAIETPSLRSHLVTCGSGGAFLHPTHCRDVQDIKTLDRSRDEEAIGKEEICNRIRVGRSADAVKDGVRFDAERRRYPDVQTSRALGHSDPLSILRARLCQPGPLYAKRFWAQLWDSNVGFAICLGLLYGFNAYVNSLVFSPTFIPDDFGPMTRFTLGEGIWKWLHAMVYSPIALIINVIMMAGCMRIAWEGPVSWPEKLLSGILHGLLHSIFVFALYWAGCYWAHAYIGNAFLASVFVWVFVTVGGIFIGGLLFGIYFAIANAWFGQMPNNAFSALAIQDYKGFLRFKLSNGELHAYFIGIDNVDRDTAWKSVPSQHWEIKDGFTV